MKPGDVANMKRIEINIPGKGKVTIDLDARNPQISQELYQMLPIEARANLWGEEVYFEIPLKASDENVSPSAVKGDVSYWSPGCALCIFFGETQPYSPVNHLGRIAQGIEILRNVNAGDRIVLNRI
ncbi:MAG: cyclophilin-like fold protein [Methanotrichaceae archaeon]